MWVRILDLIGLTNLADVQVSQYYQHYDEQKSQILTAAEVSRYYDEEKSQVTQYCVEKARKFYLDWG